MNGLVYIAGPYRGDTYAEIQRNIERAAEVGVEVARLGYYPVIPHNNTAHFDTIAPDVHQSVWLQGTMELLRRCDAMVLVEGWQDSRGTIVEIEEAMRRGIHVFGSVEELKEAGGG